MKYVVIVIVTNIVYLNQHMEDLYVCLWCVNMIQSIH